ncbi:HEAT repeat protein [Tahibacter aquaticus]|uniref:HEAT repeat protein n=1 Tax=Tahibacter aquaticus TaxID=520092 RepID=A0A4R6YRB7_9GAMM|nr:HEAT repeat domain-containing protein [Tahibacter aquaticus]TDR40419.1 HEAT repeat protein [Tahibacter aquaticus]
MRKFLAILLLWIPQANAADLASQIAGSDGWTSWQVSKVADAGEPCCYDLNRGGVDRIGCDLDGGNWSVSVGSRNSQAKPASTDQLTVYAHVSHGKVDKIRAYAATCPVNTRQVLRPLPAVAAADSVAWLERQVAGGSDAKHIGDETVMALAFHADSAAQQALLRLAAAGQPEKRRETALFWLGQARGAQGVAAVEGFARDDADEDIRRHALFVLSQAEEFDTYPKLLASARNDRAGEVRSQAMFWMAQMKDSRAGKDILGLLDKEQEADVREQAVFALSQLPDKAGDQALIEVLRGHYPRDVKQKALFWLGQSGSDEALAFLDQVLN